MSASAPASVPCPSCPYRRDVPSGVWDASEYDKLPGYDADTPAQPTAALFCHQRNGRLCSGWVGCHDMRESLGLRLAVSMGRIDGEAFDAAIDYNSPVELFESGAEAAEHGRAEIRKPGPGAQRIIGKIERRRHIRAKGGLNACHTFSIPEKAIEAAGEQIEQGLINYVGWLFGDDRRKKIAEAAIQACLKEWGAREERE